MPMPAIRCVSIAGYANTLTPSIAARFNFIDDGIDDFGQRHDAEVLVAARADGDGLGVALFVADDKDVGRLLQGVFADFVGDFFVA